MKKKFRQQAQIHNQDLEQWNNQKQAFEDLFDGIENNNRLYQAYTPGAITITQPSIVHDRPRSWTFLFLFCTIINTPTTLYPLIRPRLRKKPSKRRTNHPPLPYLCTQKPPHNEATLPPANRESEPTMKHAIHRRRRQAGGLQTATQEEGVG